MKNVTIKFTQTSMYVKNSAERNIGYIKIKGDTDNNL